MKLQRFENKSHVVGAVIAGAVLYDIAVAVVIICKRLKVVRNLCSSWDFRTPPLFNSRGRSL